MNWWPRQNQYGTWGTTQATVLALKAITEFSEGSDIKEQTVVVSINGEEQKIDIGKNSLDVYEVDFENLSVENHFSIELEKGKMSYEIVKNYYEKYDNVKENDLVKIMYKKCGTGKLYNRIDKIELISNNIHEILTGVISNTNNVRGSKGKQKDEVCFCLKQKGNKVFYCYINKDLAKSMFFSKGNSVQLEVTEENRNTNHKSYKVVSIWKA